jgi:hypothetical protein
MSARNLFLTFVRIIALVIVYLILEMVTGGIGTVDLPPLPAEKVPAAFLGLFLVALVDSLVVALIVYRSRWHGWKLIVGLGVALFGVMAVMAQIETIYFAPALGIDPSLGLVVLVRNLVTVVVFIPFAVLILGRMRGEGDEAPGEMAKMPAIQWGWKLAAIAVVYLVLYFGFGYIVAWQNPSLREMYGSGSNQAVFNAFQLIPLQLGRGILWALFAFPVIRMVKAKPWFAAVIVGLLLALPMNIVHAVPNTLMPDPTVRLSHFIETSTSNFLFGMVIYWLLHRRHASVADLFGSHGNPSTERPTMKMAGD